MNRALEMALFNDEEKFTLFRNTLWNLPEMVQFIVVRGPSSYKELSVVELELEISRRIFHPRGLPLPSSTASDVFGSKRIFNLPDARVAEIKWQVDTLSASLADRTFFVRQRTEAETLKKDERPRP